MKKTSSGVAAIYTVLVVLALACFVVGVNYFLSSGPVGSQNLGSVNYNTGPRFVRASSTAFSISSTSTRIAATSSPARLALTVQPVNCTTSGTVFMSLNGDVAATSGTGLAAYASTTQALGDYPNVPVVQGSIQAIVNSGTCTVLVTEWRSQY